jgi:hypothetical protein
MSSGKAPVGVDKSTIPELVGRIDGLIALLESQDNGRNHVTVTHTQAGMGTWGAAAVTACFFSALLVIAFAIVVIPELHDLKAWSDQYRGQINTLQNEIKPMLEKKP